MELSTEAMKEEFQMMTKVEEGNWGRSQSYGMITQIDISNERKPESVPAEVHAIIDNFSLVF